MQSSLLKDLHVWEKWCCLRAETDGTVQYIKPSSTLFHVSNSCWDLGDMGGFLISLSEVGCITCFDYPTSFSSEEDVRGEAWRDMQILNCKSRVLCFNQAHPVCSSVEQMLQLYHSQDTDSCGSHNLFPTVTLVSTLLFANYISQHALIMPR